MTSSINYFDANGRDYARHRPSYPSEVATQLAELCNRRALALDVGCGNGQLTRLLAERFEAVMGCDSSVDQLKAALPHPRIRYEPAPAEALPSQDRSLDLITAAQAAHWFDLQAFYGEARRTLRRSGVIALLTYGVPEIEGDYGKAFRTWYFGDAYRWWPAARQHVENAYRDFPFPFDELAFEPSFVSRQWTTAELCAYIATWSAARRAGENNVDLARDAAAALAAAGVPDNEPLSIRWPISGRVGRQL